MLHIFNTLSGEKEPFIPRTPGTVSIYTCGMTVYDLCHLGHARTLVAFDMISRHFRARQFEVTLVRNITDIDDKIIQRAHLQKTPWDQLTAEFIEALHEDERALGIAPPTHEPRATAFIPQMLELIDLLIDVGAAYATPHGDVYFAVREFPGY